MTTTLNILIVEDDYDDLQFAAGIVEKSFSDVKVFRAAGKTAAMPILSTNDIDILILDILLPDGTGFDIAREIRNTEKYRFLHIVFITGKDYDPLNTFRKYHCYQFITKPYTEKLLVSQLKPLVKGVREEKAAGKVRVRREVRYFETDNGDRLVPVDDILFAEIDLRVLTIHTRQGSFRARNMRFKDLLEYMDDPDFVKCHHSFAVNIRNMTGIEKGGGRYYYAVFDSENAAAGGAGCLISQRKYKEIKELLESRS